LGSAISIAAAADPEGEVVTSAAEGLDGAAAGERIGGANGHSCSLWPSLTLF
jgi:hypothetical protein